MRIKKRCPRSPPAVAALVIEGPTPADPVVKFFMYTICTRCYTSSMAKKKKAVHWQNPRIDFAGICGKSPVKGRFTDKVKNVTCKTCQKRLYAHIHRQGKMHGKQFTLYAARLLIDYANVLEVEGMGWGK